LTKPPPQHVETYGNAAQLFARLHKMTNGLERVCSAWRSRGLGHGLVQLGLAIAIGAAYFFAAQFSLALLAKPDGLAVFWPGSGLAAGILIAIRSGAQLPVTVGVVAASVAASLLSGQGLAAAAVFSLCNGIEALVVAWLIKHSFGKDFRLESLRSVLGFFAAAAIGPAISAIPATAGFVLFHNSGAPGLTTWLNWFASDALGIIMVAPLFIGLGALRRDRPGTWELAEGTLTLVALACISAVAFGAPLHYWYTGLPLALLLPVLLAAHCRPVFAAAAALILSFAVVWTTTFGMTELLGPQSLSDRTYAARATLLAISTCMIVLAALFAERRSNETAIKGTNNRLQLALDAAELSAAHRDVLNAELDHRAKNLLAIVGAIITQTQRANYSMETFVHAIEQRIASLARLHELLSCSRWQGVTLHEIAQRELAPYASSNAAINGPNVTLKAEAAQALAMVLHELITNAAKYGAFSNQNGRVQLGWRWIKNASHDRLAIEWQEIGGPVVASPSLCGYGTSIIRELIPFELGGTVDLEFASEGLCCRLEIPANWISADGSREMAHQSNPPSLDNRYLQLEPDFER
jgi:two-component sensor histidine kinase